MSGYVYALARRQYTFSMNENEWMAQLKREGFGNTCVWQDGPGARYQNHTHQMETAHVILNGEMTLTMNDSSKTCHVGERCDVPANVIHSAVMGPHGCRYLIGER